MTSYFGFLISVAVDCNSYVSGIYYHHLKMRHKKWVNSVIIFVIIVMVIVSEFSSRK